MIRFFQTPQKSVIATEVDHQLNEQEIKELNWLYGEATLLDADKLDGYFVGPRREMVTPWSTNAVEITQNMGLKGISRIEEYWAVASKDAEHDEMLQRMYNGLNQDIFTINIKPEPIKYVDNLEEYNEQEGLALSPEEIQYLHGLEKQNGRPLTDSEIFGFAQITRYGRRDFYIFSSFRLLELCSKRKNHRVQIRKTLEYFRTGEQLHGTRARKRVQIRNSL